MESGAGDGAEGPPPSGRDLGPAGRRRPLAADQGLGRGRLAAPGMAGALGKIWEDMAGVSINMDNPMKNA